MQKFLKKIALNLFGFLILLFLIFLIPRNIRLYGFEYNNHKLIHSQIDKLKGNLNLIIGDSRSQLDIGSMSGYTNLSLGGSTPLEGYYLINEIISKGVLIDTLLISYSPFHIHSQDTYWDRTVYYDFFEQEEIREVNFNIKKLNDSLYTWKPVHDLIPLQFEFLIKDFQSSIKSIPKYFLNKNKSFDNMSISKGCFTPEYLGDKENEMESKINFYYINKLKSILDKNNIKYFYFHTPLPKGSLIPSKSYFEYYFEVTKKLNPLYHEIPMWDYYLFMDCSHLKPQNQNYFKSFLKTYLHN